MSMIVCIMNIFMDQIVQKGNHKRENNRSATDIYHRRTLVGKYSLMSSM